MAPQIPPVPNSNVSGHPSHDRSVHESSTASDTAYEAGEQPSPTLTNTSNCSACSKIDWDNPDFIKKPVHGWPELAKAMEQYPEFEAFPTFRDLNIKSLLYYQAQLDDFRHRLQLCEWQDHRGSDGNYFEDSDTFNSDVRALLKCKGTGRSCMQLNLITDMRRVLKEYSML